MIFCTLFCILILSIGLVSASNNDLDSSSSIDLVDSGSINVLDDSGSIDLVDSGSINVLDDSKYDSKEYDSNFIGNDLKTSSKDETKLSSEIPKYGVNVINVGHSGNDTYDIQNAINIANSGDVVYLGEYTYNVGYAQLNINKNITFKGEGNNTLIFGYGYGERDAGNNSKSSLLFVSASGAIVDNIRFCNIDPNLAYTDWDTLYGWALKINSSAKRVSVTNCSFINFNHGVYSAGDYTSIYDSYFTGVATRVMSSKTTGNGRERGTKCIHLEEANNCIIDGNVFDGQVLDGILLEYGCMNTQITRNQFNNNAYAIYLYGADLYYDAYYNRGTLIKNNTFNNCGHFDGYYYSTHIAFDYLGIIDGEETYLTDLGIVGNTFVLSNRSIIIKTLEDDPAYVGGNINFTENNVRFIDDSVKGDTIVIFDYEAGLMKTLDLDGEIRLVDNAIADGIITALFYDYYADSYDYWTSYLGDLILPANLNYTKIYISAPDANAGDSTTVRVRFSDDDNNPLNASVKFFVDDGAKVEVKTIEVVDGEGNYTLNNLSGGIHYIGVGFGGNSTYHPSYDIENFTVSSKGSNLDISLNKYNKIFIDDVLTLKINLTDEDSHPLAGEIKVNLYDKDLIIHSFNVTVTDGIYDLPLNLSTLIDNIGNYTIDAIFEGDYQYLSSNDSLIFNVISKKVKLDIIVPDSLVVGDLFNITVRLVDTGNNPLNGTVDLRIGENNYAVNVTEGTGVLKNIALMKKGNYTINATFDSDSYEKISTYANLMVLAKETTLSASIIRNSQFNFTVDLTLKSGDEKLSGALDIAIDNKPYKVVYAENSKAIFNIDDIFEIGIHNLSAKYYGDDVYSPSAINQYFTIKSEDNPYIIPAGKTLADLQMALDSASPNDIIYLGNDTVVYAGISNLNITRDVTILSDGAVIFTAGDKNPIFNVLEDNIKLNMSSVKFICSNDDTIVSSNQSEVIFVLYNNTLTKSGSKVNPQSVSLLSVLSDVDESYYSELIDNHLEEGMVLVKLVEPRDNSENASDSNGTEPANGTNGTGDNGTNPIDNGTNQNGTDNNGTGPDNGTDAKATVTTILVHPFSVKVNESIIIFPTVRSNGKLVDGQADILIDGAKIASVALGEGFRYTPTVEGSFNVSANFIASEEYNASSSNIVVITVNPSSIDSDANGTNGSNGTDGNGTAPANGTNQSNGSVIARKASKIIYSDMITTSVNAKVDGRIGDYFVVKLTDADGKALKNKFIQIGFNGAIYNRTTDENGNAKLQINLINSGVYTFAICYLGDDEYNASFVVSKITVKKQTAKLTAPSKSYKASAKTKTLTATLKSSKGNPISGKTLSFVVNGKTYTAKTNSKGVASVKVSLSKKGTYSFTVKFAGDDAYSAISIKSKLTIK